MFTSLTLDLLQKCPTLVHPPLLDPLPPIPLDMGLLFVHRVQMSLDTGTSTMSRESLLPPLRVILLMLPQLVLRHLARRLKTS
jgi:hypothetical protein